MTSEIAIEFYLDAKSGIAPYLQLVHQVRRALKLGALREGDQLPTVREVVTRIAINPNTVSKAYRELEHEGLVTARAGVGTFVTASTSEDVLASLGPIRHDLEQWLVRARAAGLDDDSIEALFRAAFRNPAPVAS
jgi:GntR family transcriptional regulator